MKNLEQLIFGGVCVGLGTFIVLMLINAPIDLSVQCSSLVCLCIVLWGLLLLRNPSPVNFPQTKIVVLPRTQKLTILVGQNQMEWVTA